jgi:hypothetical protein
MVPFIADSIFFRSLDAMRKPIAALLFAAALIVAPAAQAQEWVFTGNIASADQYDLHTVELIAGETATATLVCDEVAPGDRPLDPVLSVYFPNNPGSDDTINANVYNDDGFGQDDFPIGVDCNAFDSSIVQFTALASGTYTFRADGFGSATGPYTLTIGLGQTWISIPTLGEVGFATLALALAMAAVLVLRRRRQA